MGHLHLYTALCRFCSLALCICLLFGCTRLNMSQEDLEIQMMEHSSASVLSTPAPQEQTDLCLPVSDEGIHNPFAYAGTTPSVVPLIYQSLFYLDDNYCPQPQLAGTLTMGAENTSCTVTLRTGARFSDGSAVSAADVVASLREALRYPQRFTMLAQTVSGCREENGAVVITLQQPERNIASLLTFPVCKAGTQSQDIPLGSGPFVYQTGSNLLEQNPYYPEDSLSIQKVELIPVSDEESLGYMLKIGVIDFYFSANATPDSYSHGSREYVTLNRLTYLGANRQSGALLSNDSLWQLILDTIQKEQLVSYACGNTASITNVPFHPGYWQHRTPNDLPQSSQPESAPLSQSSSPSQPEQPLSIQQIMQQLGYSQQDAEGYWCNSYQGAMNRFTLRIVINTENTVRHQLAQLLREQLGEIGIETQIVSEAYASYLQTIASRQFDLYIGEVQLDVNMDLSHLFTEENCAKLGFPYHADLLEAARQLQGGQISDEAFLSLFFSYGTMEPLYYQRGTLCYTRNLTADFIDGHRELFYRLEWY